MKKGLVAVDHTKSTNAKSTFENRHASLGTFTNAKVGETNEVSLYNFLDQQLPSALKIDVDDIDLTGSKKPSGVFELPKIMP